MTVARLERWIRLMPPQELTQPVIAIDGRRLTPLEMLNEARAGTEIGQKAQAQWESLGLGTEEEMLIERIKKRLSRYPQDKPLFHTLSGTYTPAQILEQVNAKTSVGIDWIETERRYLKYIGGLKERT